MRRDFGFMTALATSALCLAACSGGASPSAPGTSGGNNGGNGTPPSNTITVGTGAFSPVDITVPVNATVTWNWNSCSSDPYAGQSCVSHSVAFDDTTIAGSAVQSSGSFSKSFPAAGVYTYHCAVHGTAMSGKVTVQ